MYPKALRALKLAEVDLDVLQGEKGLRLLKQVEKIRRMKELIISGHMNVDTSICMHAYGVRVPK